MAVNNSQMKMVIEELIKNGKVCRNWCLKNYISRLSAIIYVLRYDYGWDFQGSRVYYDESDKTHWDYCYKVIKYGQNPYKQDDKS